jgi:hypothetical protein
LQRVDVIEQVHFGHDQRRSPSASFQVAPLTVSSYGLEVGEAPLKNVSISAGVTFPSLSASITLKILAWAVWNTLGH